MGSSRDSLLSEYRAYLSTATRRCTHYLQIDYVPLTHAVHRMSGIVAPASPASTALELGYQLQLSGSVALFTCVPLLKIAVEAARAKGIPDDRIFILPMQGDCGNHGFTTVWDLIEEGKKLPDPVPVDWSNGQGERQVAYLCFSSGTSGMPVGFVPFIKQCWSCL